MASLSVKDLKVVNLEDNQIYDVYGLIHDVDVDYFLVFNECLRKENRGFKYLRVTRCVPYKEEEPPQEV